MTAPEHEAARQAGEAIADAVMDAVEGIAMKLADAIAETRAEQAELRDEVLALSNRVESVTQLLQAHGAALGKLSTGDFIA